MPPLDPEATWLKPGQIAERAGVAVSTLHYYESIGLIDSRRTAGNRREYRRDTLRIIESRNDHLNWMHTHFADETLVAGEESEIELGPGQPSGKPYPAPPEAPARHPRPILPY